MAEKSIRLRISETLLKDLDGIAEDSGKSRNDVILNACKMYRDYTYMETKASLLPEHILRSMQATITGLEERLNNKSNQLLSTMAIEIYIIEHILAAELEIEADDIISYRRDAVEVMKRNNRIFRMDETLP